MQHPQFDQSTREEFMEHFTEVSKQVANPQIRKRIAKINASILVDLEKDAPFEHAVDVKAPEPPRYFDRLENETEAELIERWKNGYLSSTNAPTDERVTLDHPGESGYNGYSTKANSKKTLGAFDVKPEQLNLPSGTPMSQDLLISRFMPVVPEALRVILDNEAMVREELEAAPIETKMETEDTDM